MPFKGPRLMRPEQQRYKETGGCAALGEKAPQHCQEQLSQTLNVGLLEPHFFVCS